MKHLTCGFIGLGLIGGSIAKALKLHEPSTRIYAYDIDQEALALAQNEGNIDLVLQSLEDSTPDATGKSTYCLSQCDIIFLCAPVSKNNEQLTILKKYITSDTLLTDVGSVKSGIHKQVTSIGLNKQFIGGHPMTGSEKSGYKHSQAIILENAYYILTPAEGVSAEKTALLKDLVTTIGSIPILLEPDKHDYVTAAISHVPHLIAAALVNLVHDSDSEDGMMKTLAAGGFKDITRIASSSPTMWEAICMENPDHIASLLNDYIQSLTAIKHVIENRQTGIIHDIFVESSNYRNSFADAAKGPIKKTYDLYIDIPDVTGSIATLATILASHAISIKNIGIIHNREFEEGVLRIEFYEEQSKQNAFALLTKMQYTIFDRK